jgi:hypothetical protein
MFPASKMAGVRTFRAAEAGFTRGAFRCCISSKPVHLPGEGALEHFSLLIDDMGEMLKRLEARAIPCRHIQSANGLGRQAFLKDPNGVIIKLI